ncbi:MAG: hypothetical protein JWM57_4416 [Phycisphaerales bacterium]|nr:hypothetical protein [Phycisphaerales bacterium]
MLFKVRPSVKALALSALLVFATLLGAAEVKKASPRVTVVKNDKTSINGEFVEATPAGVTLKSLKGDAGLVPWADIKSVSNGLTHQKIVDDWKTSHAELLCDTCKGNGETKCETCHGTGVDPANAKPCEKCKGTGDLGKCPKCKDGKVPCSASCLKRSDFHGEIDKANNVPMSRLFRNKDGSGFHWHEGHIGDLVVQENGTWVDKGKCPTCAGTSQIICPTCHGTAKRECQTCRGAGVTGPACTVCKGDQTACATCGGSGLKASAKPAGQ